MLRRYGWGPRGERVIEAVPHGHWTTTTLIHAIAASGTRAAMITNGPVNKAVFEKFVDWLLAPALRPGDVVVMDNLPVHRSREAIERIEAAGAKAVFLPPYSPDLNPIEKIFSKVKTSLRRAAARTTTALYAAIAAALDSITPADCRNTFAACGYRVR